MKKLVMLSMSALMIMFVTALNAQEAHKTAMNTEKNSVKHEKKMEKKEIRHEERNAVSDLSKDAFVSDFGKIQNVGWEKDNLYDIAIFTKDGAQYKAYYDETSKLVGTTTGKTFADLPKSAQNEINKKYKDYKIDKVIFFNDNEHNESDMLLYGTQFADADNYFVELTGNNKNIVLQVNPKGEMFFFKELHKTL